jgi:hypothetical protein
MSDKERFFAGPLSFPGCVLAVGMHVSREEADRLPDGSSVRRVDGPRAPYAALVKRKGLWEGPRGNGGLGTATWEILAIGPGGWDR